VVLHIGVVVATTAAAASGVHSLQESDLTAALDRDLLRRDDRLIRLVEQVFIIINTAVRVETFLNRDLQHRVLWGLPQRVALLLLHLVLLYHHLLAIVAACLAARSPAVFVQVLLLLALHLDFRARIQHMRLLRLLRV